MIAVNERKVVKLFLYKLLIKRDEQTYNGG